MTHAAPNDEGIAPLLEALDRMLARLPMPPPRAHAEGECAAVPFELWKRALLGPAEEFLRRPGKEFRGKLTQLAWLGAGGRARGPMPRALPWVVELIHAGSLIVDDVQDDSSHRRGSPSLHRIVGVPLAINTGNWMYFWALSLIEELPLPPTARAELTLDAVTALMHCHHGQALDLSVHVGHLEPRHIPATVATTTRNKTGMLMGLAARVGAVAAGADAERVAGIAEFGVELGIGLQMLDDLGAVASRSRRDKGLEDIRGGRPTWPWAWMCGAVDELAVARLQQRLRGMSNDDDAEHVLSAIRESALTIGRGAVRSQLQHCLQEVATHLDAEAHRALVGELERLEVSYG
jgi:geranylgeranyl pyrophosphate synthase